MVGVGGEEGDCEMEGRWEVGEGVGVEVDEIDLGGMVLGTWQAGPLSSHATGRTCHACVRARTMVVRRGLLLSHCSVKLCTGDPTNSPSVLARLPRSVLSPGGLACPGTRSASIARARRFLEAAMAPAVRAGIMS